MIKCPTCGESKFELHTVGALVIRQNKPELTKAAKYFTCVHCEYVIAQPSDLSPTEIVVYILGNSLSKQRQGLREIFGDASPTALAAAIELLQQEGYLGPNITHDIPCNGDPWIFTRAAWEKYQADPKFKLGEGPHVIKTKEMF